MDTGLVGQFFGMAEAQGGDPYNQKGKDKSPPSGSGLTQKLDVKVLGGKAAMTYDSRIFTHDRVAARADPLQWTIGKDDRLTAGEAAEALLRLKRAAGIDRANSNVEEAFIDALCFSHSVNSGSVLQPGRGNLDIAGFHPVPFIKVVEILGTDFRRFFRTIANETRRVNRKIIEEAYKVDDIVAQEKYQWLMEVAFERGLHRFPHLAHDSSNACWDLTPEERSAVAVAKYFSIDQKVNAADTPKGDSNPKSIGSSVYEAASLSGGSRVQ